jgi:hypothetical protein
MRERREVHRPGWKPQEPAELAEQDAGHKRAPAGARQARREANSASATPSSTQIAGSWTNAAVSS